MTGSIEKTPERVYRRGIDHRNHRIESSMPHYYFDIENGLLYSDDVGSDLENDQAAWREALRLVRDIEDVLLPGGNWHLGVRKGGAAIYRIDISTKWLHDTVTP